MLNQPMTLNDICRAARRKTPEYGNKPAMVKDSVMGDGSHNYVPIINAEYDEDFDAIVLTTPLSDMDRPPTIRYTGDDDAEKKMRVYQEELLNTRDYVLLAFYGLGALSSELLHEDIETAKDEAFKIMNLLVKALGFDPEAVKDALKED